MDKFEMSQEPLFDDCCIITFVTHDFLRCIFLVNQSVIFKISFTDHDPTLRARNPIHFIVNKLHMPFYLPGRNLFVTMITIDSWVGVTFENFDSIWMFRLFVIKVQIIVVKNNHTVEAFKLVVPIIWTAGRIFVLRNIHRNFECFGTTIAQVLPILSFLIRYKFFTLCVFTFDTFDPLLTLLLVNETLGRKFKPFFIFIIPRMFRLFMFNEQIITLKLSITEMALKFVVSIVWTASRIFVFYYGFGSRKCFLTTIRIALVSSFLILKKEIKFHLKWVV